MQKIGIVLSHNILKHSVLVPRLFSGSRSTISLIPDLLKSKVCIYFHLNFVFSRYVIISILNKADNKYEVQTEKNTPWFNIAVLKIFCPGYDALVILKW